MLLFWRIFILFPFVLESRSELWEKELGQEVYIEASVEGLKAVHLECSKDSMKVKIDLEESGFDGVVYTRGSYQMGKAPCFYDAQGSDNEELTLQWKYKDCKVENLALAFKNPIKLLNTQFSSS